MPNKPTTIPVLDTNQTNRVAPAAAKLTDGYVLNDTLPASNANYLWGWAGDWLTWLDGTFDDGAAAGDLQLLGNVGIGVSAAVDLHVSGGDDTRMRLQDTTAAYTALSLAMSGVELVSGGMDNTNKYATAVKWLSTDAAFTTQNPKLLAAITGRSTENYAADTDGGMAIDFFTTPNNPGATNVPVLTMSLERAGSWVDIPLALGLATPLANKALRVEQLQAAASYSEVGVFVARVNDDGAAESAALVAGTDFNLAGGESRPTVGSGVFTLDMDGAGSITNYYGVRSQIDVNGGGAITTARLFRCKATVPSGTVTDLFGYRYDPKDAGGGTVTNEYGVYVGSVANPATLGYGVYIAGAKTAALHVASGTTELVGPVAIDDASGSTDASLYVQRNQDGTGYHRAGVFEQQLDVSCGANVQACLEVVTDCNQDTGESTDDVWGIYAHLDKDLAGTIGDFKCVRASSNIVSGTVTTLSHFASEAFFFGGITVGTFHHFYCTDPGGAGVPTDQYGLRIGNLTGGTNNYGIRLEGASTYALWVESGNSLLAGPVALAAGTPSALTSLDVMRVQASASDESLVELTQQVNAESAGAAIALRATADVNLTTGTKADVRGLVSILTKDGAGTVTAHRNIWSGATVNSGTVTTYYGLYAAAATGAGTIDTEYGVWIGDAQKGTAAYGLYIEGGKTHALWVDSGTVRLDGNVGIQVTTPAARLDVGGGDTGDLLLRFSTDRPWVWTQVGDDASTSLRLKQADATSSGKEFSVASFADNVALAVLPHDTAASARVYLVPAGGYVGVGQASAAAALDVNGDVTTNGEVKCDETVTYANRQAPASQRDLAMRHQQNLVLARCRFSAAGTLTGDHYNVSTVARDSEGVFTATLDQAVDDDCQVMVTVSSQVGSILYCAEAYIKTSGTQVEVHTYRIGQGSTTGSINTTGGAAYVSLDDASLGRVQLAIIGRPRTLQT